MRPSISEQETILTGTAYLNWHECNSAEKWRKNLTDDFPEYFSPQSDVELTNASQLVKAFCNGMLDRLSEDGSIHYVPMPKFAIGESDHVASCAYNPTESIIFLNAKVLVQLSECSLSDLYSLRINSRTNAALRGTPEEILHSVGVHEIDHRIFHEIHPNYNPPRERTPLSPHERSAIEAQLRHTQSPELTSSLEKLLNC